MKITSGAFLIELVFFCVKAITSIVYYVNIIHSQVYWTLPQIPICYIICVHWYFKHKGVGPETIVFTIAYKCHM